MFAEQHSFLFYRVLQDKSEQELAVVTVTAAKAKAGIVSQFIDFRTDAGETFATLTFPSWVKVRKVGK